MIVVERAYIECVHTRFEWIVVSFTDPNEAIFVRVDGCQRSHKLNTHLRNFFFFFFSNFSNDFQWQTSVPLNLLNGASFVLSELCQMFALQREFRKKS